LCVRALGAIADPRAIEPLCRLTTSENQEIRREAVHTLTQFARLELADDQRAQVMATLEAAGANVGRSAPPLAGRSNSGPEAARPASRSTPSGHGAEASAAAKPAPAMLNFQMLEPGTVLIDRFRVVERIGGGGFGTVYLVEDTSVREELVLKVLSPQFSLDEIMIRRFVQELKFTRRITHRNVIRIYDLLDLNGARAISMEYFPGRDLGQVLRDEGPLPVSRALYIAEQVLEGLAAAHELDIVHRDMKPGNLLIGADDFTKIVDFGLAAAGESTASRLTKSGVLLGTPEFISPEQITGQEVDGRSDLYALGCVLYQTLSGREPFSGESAVNTLFQHLEADVPPLTALVPGIPEAVSDLIASSMCREASGRPASALVMLDTLRTLRKAA